MGTKTRSDYGLRYHVTQQLSFTEMEGTVPVTTAIPIGQVIDVVSVIPQAGGDCKIEIRLPKGDLREISQEDFDTLIEHGFIREDELALSGENVPLRTSMQRKAYQEMHRLARECHPDDLKQFIKDCAENRI